VQGSWGLMCPVSPPCLDYSLPPFPARGLLGDWGASFQASRNRSSPICPFTVIYAQLSPAAEIRTHPLTAPVLLGQPNFWPTHTPRRPLIPKQARPAPHSYSLPPVLLFPGFLRRLFFLEGPASPPYYRSAISSYLPLLASIAAWKVGAKRAVVNPATKASPRGKGAVEPESIRFVCWPRLPPTRSCIG
jgi:hypothetical protein